MVAEERKITDRLSLMEIAFQERDIEGWSGWLLICLGTSTYSC